MLFDLQGKRRNVIKVAYAMLAVLFVFGTILFGIGTDVGQGLVDGLVGRDGGADAESIYAQQLEDAQESLAADPENPELLLDAARLSFLHGAQLTTTNAEDQMVSTPESTASFNRALDYWNAYMETDPDKPEVSVAGQMVFAARLMENATAAAKIQEVIIEEAPSDIAYRDMALFLYAQGLIEEGREAADKAVALTSEEEKEEAKEWRKELHKGAVDYQKAMEKYAELNPDGDKPQLPNPFSSLGQQSGQLPPGFGQ